MSAWFPLGTLGYSKERAVLYSLHYNGILSSSPSLRNAINQGDRATAWMEIRYYSNGNRDGNGALGLQNRRDHESETFGLFNSGTNTTTDLNEAIENLSTVFKRYRSIIGGSILLNDGSRKYYGEDLIGQLTPALNLLKNEFADGADIHRVYSGDDIPSTLMDHVTSLGFQSEQTFSNDLIFSDGSVTTISAGGGDDVVFGSVDSEIEERFYLGDGDDRLYAGDGNAVVNTGSGNDTIFTGAGNDRIVSQGLNGDSDAVYSGGGNDEFLMSKDGEYYGEAGEDTYTWTRNNNVVVAEYEPGNKFKINGALLVGIELNSSGVYNPIGEYETGKTVS